MNKDYNRASLLEDISCKWNTDDVVALLKKNGLIESCAAIITRQLDGKGLLSLTEQNFNSWKNDLSISCYWNLHRFVTELKNNPEHYLLFEKKGSTSSSASNSDVCSDTDPWDTDFDDDNDDDDIARPNTNHERISKSADQDRSEKNEGQAFVDHDSEMQYWQNKSGTHGSWAPPSVAGLKKPPAYLKRQQQEEEEVKTEEEDDDEDENFYANGIDLDDPSLSQVSAAKNKFENLGQAREKDLTVLLQEQLQLRKCKNNKPTLSPKPKMVLQNQVKVDPKPPPNGNKSFLTNLHPAKIRTNNTDNQPTQSKVSTIKTGLFSQNSSQMLLKKTDRNAPALPKPKITPSSAVLPINRELPKPPSPSSLLIGKLDFLADLPRSDKHVNTIGRLNSPQSLPSPRSVRSSIESVYPPCSISSLEEEEIDEKEEEEEEEEEEDTTYESINEMPVVFKHASDDGYLEPKRPPVSNFPCHRPINLPIISPVKVGRQLLRGLGSRLADEVADMIVRIKRGLLRCCHAQNSESPEPLEIPEPPERSPDKKIGIYPTSGNQTRVTRPLPSPPDLQKSERPVDISIRKIDNQFYKTKPWFHNVNREQAEALITGGGTEFCSTPQNGYFLLRPSGNSAEQPFTLVLWYRNRPFNIPVRKRPDSRFALGSAKLDEQSFECVEEMVNFHKQKELVLHRNGVPVGNTRLTDTPPRRND